jgi:uncharacterized protein YndB with AHSA1/START domain
MTEAIRQGDIPGVQIRRRRRLPASSRDEVWRWLTDASRLRQWLSPAVALSGSPPARLEIGIDEATEVARTVSAEPPARWVLDFERVGAGWGRATRVTFEVTGDVGDSELSILHEGFQHLPLSLCLPVWETYRERWADALERLEKAIADSDAP